MDMFAEMGDKIALQYGGSEAHNKVCCMHWPVRQSDIIGNKREIFRRHCEIGAGRQKWTSCQLIKAERVVDLYQALLQ